MSKSKSKEFLSIYHGVIRWSLQSLFVIVVIFVAVLALSKPAFDWMQQTVFHDMLGQLEFIISLTLTSIFPITAIAYLLFQHGTRVKRLARGFYLLGIDVKGDTKEDIIKKIDRENQNRHPDYLGDQGAKPPDWDLQAYGDYFRRTDDRSLVSWNYVAQSTFAVLTTVLGLSLFFWFPREMLALEPEEYTLFAEAPSTLQAMRYGFLGSYVFSIQLVYRRYTTFDLNPIVYMSCALTMIAGIIFNLVAFEALDALTGGNAAQSTTGLAGGVLAIVAFSLGYFPYLAIRWFNRVGYGALGVEERRANALPLGLIDGISQAHETRLRDEGIDNIQNLASAPLDELLMNTRFGAQEVAEWVDQAILYLYLEPADIDPFRRGGIRSFTDLEDTWGPYFRAYHTVGKPSQKLIESFRHIEGGFSGLNWAEFQALTSDRLTAWQNDHKRHYSAATTPNSDTATMYTWLAEQLEQARTNFATPLKATPDYLDSLYLATQLGPNVAHIKHYWQTADKIQACLLDSRSRYAKRLAAATFKKVGEMPRQEVSEAAITQIASYQSLEQSDEWENEDIWMTNDDEHEWLVGEERVDLLLGKARVAKALGKIEEAIEAYEKVVELAPERDDILNEVAWFYVHELDPESQEGGDRLDSALELAETAVKIAGKATANEPKNAELKTSYYAALDTRAAVKIMCARQVERDPEERRNLLESANSDLEKIPEGLAEQEYEDLVDTHRKDIEEIMGELQHQPPAAVEDSSSLAQRSQIQPDASKSGVINVLVKTLRVTLGWVEDTIKSQPEAVQAGFRGIFKLAGDLNLDVWKIDPQLTAVIGQRAISDSAVDIIAMVRATGNLDRLEDELDAAGLVGTLRNGGPFTLLAPADSAFGDLLTGTAEAWRQGNENTPTEVLQYHIVRGKMMIADLHRLDGKTVDTIGGDTLRISVEDDAIIINDVAKLVESVDIEASNGVVHAIDRVLERPVREFQSAAAMDTSTTLREDDGVPSAEGNDPTQLPHVEAADSPAADSDEGKDETDNCDSRHD